MASSQALFQHLPLSCPTPCLHQARSLWGHGLCWHWETPSVVTHCLLSESCSRGLALHLRGELAVSQRTFVAGQLSTPVSDLDPLTVAHENRSALHNKLTHPYKCPLKGWQSVYGDSLQRKELVGLNDLYIPFTKLNSAVSQFFSEVALPPSLF